MAALESALADLSHVQPPPLSSARYSETAEIFEAASDQRDRMLAWAAEALLPHLPADRLSVLSVGCGSGVFDGRLLDRLEAPERRVRWTGVEPNPEQRDVLAQTLADHEAAGMEVRLVAATFQDADLTETYDFVHITHALYYMPDPDAALDYALELIGGSGTLLVFKAPNELLNAVADRFWAHQLGPNAWFSDDLAAALDRRPVSVQRVRIDARLDVTDVFQPGSERGAAIADFIAQADLQAIPGAARRSILEFWRASAREDRRGRLTLPHPVDAFLIRAGGRSEGRSIPRGR